MHVRTHTQMRGRTPSCNDANYPQYLGQFQLEIDFNDGGWMRSAWTRCADCKHDGGLSAYNFVYTTAFTGMWSYDPDADCGLAYVTVQDNQCGYF